MTTKTAKNATTDVNVPELPQFAAYTLPALKSAFAALRKQGFVAKQSFSCCRGCAGAALAQQLAANARAQQACKGAVFYTRQDRRDLEHALERYTTEEVGVYLAFGPVELGEPAEQVLGLPAEQVGAAVVKTLRGFGLHADWDGKAETCVWVRIAQGVSNRNLKQGDRVRLTRRTKLGTRTFTATVAWTELDGDGLYFGYTPHALEDGAWGCSKLRTTPPAFGLIAVEVLS